MRAFLLVAVISACAFALMHCVAGVKAEDYESNFVENLSNDVAKISESDQVEVERLLRSIVSLSGHHENAWDILMVPAEYFPRGMLDYLSSKSNLVTEKQFDEHIIGLCSRISSQLKSALDVYDSDPNVIAKYKDEIVEKWLSIGEFCLDVIENRDFYLSEIL